MAGKQFDLSVLFRVVDKATGPLKKLGQQFQGVSGKVKKLGNRFKTLAARLDKVARKMRDVGKSLLLRVTAPLTLIAGLATKAAISFESAFTGVRKTVEATEEEFAVLKKGLMDLAREIPLSTQEFFRMGEVAGQLGIHTKDIVAFTKVIADLAATTDLVGDEAAMSLARFSKITGMSVKDIDRLGATIVFLGNNLAATESEIVNMSTRLAGAGTLVGLSEAQIMGLAGALKELGIETQAGGTAFSLVMRRIDKEIGSNSDKMRGFAWVAGQTVDEFSKLWKKNAKEALLKFVEGLGRVRKEGVNVNVVLDKLGMEGIRISDALLRASGSGDSVREAMRKANKAWGENTALVKEANLRYGTTESKLTVAKTKIIQMAVAYGDILKPVLIKITKLIEPLVDWLAKLGPTTKIVLLVLAGIASILPPIMVALSFLPFMLKGIGVSLAVLSAHFLPLTLAVAGLALAAFLVIKHWKTLKPFFTDLFGGILKMIDKFYDSLPDPIKRMLGLAVKKPLDIRPWLRSHTEEQVKELERRRGLEPGTLLEQKYLEDERTRERQKSEKRKLFRGPPGLGEIPEKTSALEKGQTDINLKVMMDEGLMARLTGIKKAGGANVKVVTETYLGGTFGLVPIG